MHKFGIYWKKFNDIKIHISLKSDHQYLLHVVTDSNILDYFRKQIFSSSDKNVYQWYPMFLYWSELVIFLYWKAIINRNEWTTSPWHFLSWCPKFNLEFSMRWSHEFDFTVQACTFWSWYIQTSRSRFSFLRVHICKKSEKYAWVCYSYKW